MYICNDCGRVSEELEVRREIHTELFSEPYEEYDVCPCCGSEDVEECYYCHECGEPISRQCSIVGDDGKRYCEDCYYKKEDESFNIINYLRRKYINGDALRIDGRAVETA